jgi:DNA-binding transcriptional MerR regulator
MQPIESVMHDSFVQVQAIERFRPDPHRLYDVDMTARLAGVPRRSVLIYCRWGLVRPTTSPEVHGWYFSSDAIGAIRRAEYLRANRGVNLSGLRVIFELMDQFGRRRPTFW